MNVAPMIDPNDLFIVICDDYQNATDCFDCFVTWLDLNCSWQLMFADPYSNRVRTIDCTTYIFIEYRAIELYLDYWESFISEDEFFEGMYE